MGYQLSTLIRPISCRLADLAVLPSCRLPLPDYRPRLKTPLATSAQRAAATTPMKRRTSSSVSQTSRPRRSSEAERCYRRGWCWLSRFRFTFGLRFRSRSGIGFGRRLSHGRRHDPGVSRPRSRTPPRATCRPLPPRRQIAQPLREIVVTEKGAGIGAGTERGQVRDLLGSNIRIDGARGDASAMMGAGGSRSQEGMDARRPPSGSGGSGGSSAAASHSSISASGVPQSTQSVRLVSFQAPQPWHSVTDRPPGAFRQGASLRVRV